MKINIDKITKAIEKDAGQKVPGLHKSIKEMRDGAKGRVTKPEQILIRAARSATGLSQMDFAKLINTPTRTLQEWEQGRTTPPGAAITLMQLIIDRPRILAKTG